MRAGAGFEQLFPMRINLKTSEWTNLINIHYGAALSVVFALTVVVAQDEINMGDVHLLVEPSTWSAFIPMVVYFFVDWLVTNIRRETVEIGIVVLFMALIWTWFLGYCVLISKSADPTKFAVIGAYITIAGIYHSIRYAHNDYTPPGFGMQRLFGLFFSGILAAFGVYLGMVGTIARNANVGALGESEPFLAALWLSVFVKVFEALVFSGALPDGKTVKE